MTHLSPLAMILAAPANERAPNVLIVFGLASVIFLSFGFLIAALYINRTMSDEKKRKPPARS
jgi:hypothetical protein